MNLDLKFSSLLALPAVLIAGTTEARAQSDCTGPPSAVRLYVNVENVNAAQGLIALTLYPDDSRRFLARRGSLYVGRVPARAPTTRVCIHLPSTGTYALGVYHDADGNRRFNRTGIGMPAEGFGFTNNPRLLFGIPAFRSVRIAVPRTNMQTTIRLRYP
jgi:uncharacterized protein (DUF2141 family)